MSASGGEVDAAAGADGLDAEGDGEMGFAGAGRAEEVHHLMAGDEVELGQGQDAVAVERGLEREVEAGRVLTVASLAICSAALMRRPSRSVNSSASRVSMASSGLSLAALDLAHDVVEGLQRARHAQADQVCADPLEGGRAAVVTALMPAAPRASRRPTAA